MKNEKGITLIALIITIIVMLILVGVTVSVALNGGLFSTAKTAAVKTNRAVEEEKEDAISIEIEFKREDLLKKYPVGNPYIDYNSDPRLNLDNLNIFDLYEHILEEYYDASYDKASLKEVIKATNKVYQIYNPEVKDIIYIKEDRGSWNYWDTILGYLDETIIDESSEPEKYRNIKIQLHLGLMLGGENAGLGEDFFKANMDNKKYALISASSDFPLVINSMILGEGLPTGEITGSIASDYINSLNQFSDVIISKEIVKLDLDLIDNNEVRVAQDNSSDIVIKDEDKEKYVGSYAIMLVIDNGGEEAKDAKVISNAFIIDTKLGEIFYLDDNGKPNREIP